METLSIPAVDLSAIGPFAIVVLAAIVVLVVGVLRRSDDAGLPAALSVLGLLGALAASIGFWSQRRTAFSDMVAVDPFAGFFSAVVLVAAIVTVLLSAGRVREGAITPSEYLALLLFATSGMLLLAQATDLIMVVIAIEILSLGLYVLAGFVRARLTSPEAALKYFLLGAFAIGFAIYGSALIFGVTATTKFAGLAASVGGQGGAATNPMFLIGVGLLLIGFGFKLSIVPFHMWTPDVYEGAPTAITAFMSVATKAAVFGALLRFLTVAIPAAQPDWGAILWALAIVTMVVGNAAALVQTSVKRMLAYSSIAQAGYMLIGVIANDQLATAGIMFYLAAYALMNLGAFAVLLALGRTIDDDPQLRDLIGLGRRSPLAAVAMTVFMLSLAGIPPTAGFMAKLYVFAAGVRAGHAELVLVGVLASAAAAYYYLRVIVHTYLSSPGPAPGESVEPTTLASPLTGSLATIIAVLLVLTLVLGVLPALPLEYAQAAARLR